MKKTNNLLTIVSGLLLVAGTSINAQVGIGTDTPEGILDLNPTAGTTGGLIIPRVTATTSVINPKTNNNAIAKGTIIFDESESCIKFFNGTAWSSCLADIIDNTVTPGGPIVNSCGVKENGFAPAGTNFGTVRIGNGETGKYDFSDDQTGYYVNFVDQLKLPTNYGPAGKVNATFTFSDFSIAGVTTQNLIDNYEIIVLGGADLKLNDTNAEKLVQFTNAGGIVIAILSDAKSNSVLPNAFGASFQRSDAVFTQFPGQANAVIQNLPGLKNGPFGLGDNAGITISGNGDFILPQVNSMPLCSTVLAHNLGVGDQTGVNIVTAGEGGRAMFVFEEGLFMNPLEFSGSDIDTDQEFAMHNLFYLMLSRMN